MRGLLQLGTSHSMTHKCTSEFELGFILEIIIMS